MTYIHINIYVFNKLQELVLGNCCFEWFLTLLGLKPTSLDAHDPARLTLKSYNTVRFNILRFGFGQFYRGK